MKNFIILSLGSNENDRKRNLRAAISALGELCKVEKISSVYESDALLLPDSPAEWNKNFFNICLSAYTDLEPLALLKKLKAIEENIAGAKRELRWSPRKIDIDIIAYNDDVFEDEILSIPHRSATERTFVIWPLAEICPLWRYPQADGNGQYAHELAQNFGLDFPGDLGKKPSPLNTKIEGKL